MTDTIVKILVEALSILGIVTKEVRQGRKKKYLKKLVRRKDVKDAFQRLDKLAQEMAATEILMIVRGFDDRVEGMVRNGDSSLIEGITETRVAIQQVVNQAGNLSPMLKASAKATKSITSITHAAPQSSIGASARLPAISPGGSAAPTSALAPFPERGSGHEKGYLQTRSRVIEAVGGALSTAASIGHEVLFTGVDLLQFAPVPGLNTAGKILLNIWDAIEMVETNRQASLRLAERCADILISIRSEIADAGYTVTEELRAPIAKLDEAFGEIHYFLDKLGQRPFLKRYLRRTEILSSISACDTALNDALGMFDRAVQVRTLKRIDINELRRQKDTHDILAALSHSSPGLPPAALLSSPADTESVRNTLHALHTSQNARDRAHDMADLHQLMRNALAAKDDVAMFEVFQIARGEMPEAITTLERALERVIKDGQLDAEEGTMALPIPQEAGNGNGPSVDPGSTGVSPGHADPLDQEFIETGINALRRLSEGKDLGLPSWTITRFEIDREAKVGVGFFSDVYRGTWRNHTVAIKVLAETTPQKIFLREVGIWKSLDHPNVLKLFGASSASGDPPWFLVSKFYPRGNLVKYLKGLSDTDAARIDALRMMHEISEGMAYLHKQGVLHGDLKAANILVGDDTRCVISDFGQSEMKSEVYRITRASEPCGTLRWQAPELLEGAQELTQGMDVYAFAICCWEILTMGAVPWPLMDGIAVRHAVLNENMRPSLPSSELVNGELANVIRDSWDRIPSKRPSFEQISNELKKQRAERSP
ncbi:kinase-like domain-containing protein [Lactarius quietus]|nr:kinase-like domain-containing protein [Lactarius quietus]